ncbi:MAG: ATP-dependent RNA helicase DbpA [Fibrobacterales bacterium]
MDKKLFSTLALSKPMLHNLEELGFHSMTPVQGETLPHILDHKDVIAQAKTGSGKTAAFGIGLLTNLDVKKYRVQALVLCPTRELADQVSKELRRIARATHNVKVLTLCGGEPFGPQYGSLIHGAHIVVGTPGRVLKHLQKHNLSLEHLNTLVLDEADRMLDMGFIDEISDVISFAPKKRQTLLFSATFPERINELSSSVQQNAISVKTISTEATNAIAEHFYEVDSKEKFETLLEVLNTYRPENVIVFCSRKAQAQEVADELRARSITASAIHGDLEQYERTDMLVQFSNKSSAVLVATDVAARGLDIKELSMVINYDIAQDAETYTHRIGRTGRAGKEGIACTLMTSRQREKMDYLCSRKVSYRDSLDKAGVFSLEAPNQTLVIEGGKKDKMRPADILGALTGEGGFVFEQIGKIVINDRQTYVALANDVVDAALAFLQDGRIKGRSFPVWKLGHKPKSLVDDGFKREKRISKKERYAPKDRDSYGEKPRRERQPRASDQSDRRERSAGPVFTRGPKRG